MKYMGKKGQMRHVSYANTAEVTGARIPAVGPVEYNVTVYPIGTKAIPYRTMFYETEMDMWFLEDPSPTQAVYYSPPKPPGCHCGADSVGHPGHATYCPKSQGVA